MRVNPQSGFLNDPPASDLTLEGTFVYSATNQGTVLQDFIVIWRAGQRSCSVTLNYPAINSMVNFANAGFSISPTEDSKYIYTK